MTHPDTLRDRINAERTIPLSRYQEEGCESRSEYLEQLAMNYNVSFDTVETLADLLGPDEDFDGLANSVEDASEGEL